MLSHGNTKARRPSRVVLLGSAGFLAGAIRRHLEANDISVLALGRPVLDLLSQDAATRLVNTLKPDDTLVFASALAPCKDLSMLCDNIRMAEAVCTALRARPVAHVIYISSDAVYKDSPEPLTESSCAEPASVHGVMHLAREVALRQVYAGPLALMRPTLVYGLDDPHNGYGPNRFRRLAAAGREIILFGEGEELRDHVDIDDVAELARLIVVHRSTGIANAVSGKVVSFLELAEFAAASFSPCVPVRVTPRTGPIPHDGYRAFDNRAVLTAYPSFRFKSWREGLAAIHQRQTSEGRA